MLCRGACLLLDASIKSIRNTFDLRKSYKAMSCNVLLIEDDPLVSATVSHLLQGRGHVVTLSPHGDDAVRLFNLLAPQVVISDIILPEVDILDTIREFRRLRPETTIIAISGNPYLLTIAEKHGVDHTLRKPFVSNELAALIRPAKLQ